MNTSAQSRPKNIFEDLPSDISQEVFETLLTADKVRIERITSSGQTTPEGEGYDQSDNEWVMVLRGSARLQFADGTEHTLTPGDTLYLPAHLRHRVTWTDPEEKTIWLAIHF